MAEDQRSDAADVSTAATPWARRKVLGWDLWRATMFAGSMVLLAHAVANAMMSDELPSWVKTVAMVGGYVLLAVGFALAMRARRKS